MATPDVRLKEQLVYMNSVDCEDTRFQVREGLDPTTVEQYREIVKQGDGVIRLRGFNTRPIVWQRPEDAKFVICDGWHRIEAARVEDVTEFEAHVVSGQESDALFVALRSNLTHGLTLKPQERMEAVLRTIKALTPEDGTQPSNPDVADRLGMPESTVRNCRDKLEQTNRLPRAEKVKGRDGKVQVARKNTCRQLAACSSVKMEKMKRPVAESIVQLEPADNHDTAPPSVQTDDHPVTAVQSAGVTDHSDKITIINEDDRDSHQGTEDTQALGDDPGAVYLQPLRKVLALMAFIDEKGWSALKNGASGDEIEGLIDQVAELLPAICERRAITPADAA